MIRRHLMDITYHDLWQMFYRALTYVLPCSIGHRTIAKKAKAPEGALRQAIEIPWMVTYPIGHGTTA